MNVINKTFLFWNGAHSLNSLNLFYTQSVQNLWTALYFNNSLQMQADPTPRNIELQ